MTISIDNGGGGWVQCDWCNQPRHLEPPPSNWKVNVDTVCDYRGPEVSCGGRNCRAWKGSTDRWVGVRAVVGNPEKYGVSVSV